MTALRVKWVCLVLLLAQTAAAADVEYVTPERIWIERAASGFFQVTSSRSGALGTSGTVRGAGGADHLEVAHDSGADALRTWGVEGLGPLLASAEAHELRVSAGIWLPHEPVRYQNCSGDLDADPWWRLQLERYIDGVREHKNSSGLLWWTVGNEMELEVDVLRGNECVWRRLEWAVKAVKAEDPGHPVGTVLAGVAEPKVRGAFRLAPSLDFLGVNSYGDDSLQVGWQLRAWGWTKPYALMEFGPSGHWVSPLTEWGAYVEESSSEKVPRYNATCHSCYEDPFCIGAFAFVWGWKWEKTGTWYNMFNEWKDVTEGVAVDCPRCESEVLATLQKCWTGSERPSRPPSIHGIEVDGHRLEDMSFSVPQQAEVHLRVDAVQPQGSSLVAIWAATGEVCSDAIGGAWEATNPLLAKIWPKEAPTANTATGLEVTLNTSGMPVGSQYRLYVFVRQDPASCAEGGCHKQEASASLPFRICHTALPGEVCYGQVAYAMDQGFRLHPQTYPGANASSSFEEFQVILHQKGEASCPAPCGIRAWCHTSVAGEECHGYVKWAMAHGVRTSPDVFPPSMSNSSFEAFQLLVHTTQKGICPRPCQERSTNSSNAEVGDADLPVSSSTGACLTSALSLVIGIFVAVCFSP